jgi:hypothetical protein
VTAGGEAITDELGRGKVAAAGNVEDEEQETYDGRETLGRTQSDLKRFARCPNP